MAMQDNYVATDAVNRTCKGDKMKLKRSCWILITGKTKKIEVRQFVQPY